MLQYLLLVASMVGIIIKYFLNVVDMAREGRWENKGAYVLYLEFATDVFRLVVYMAFFTIIMAFYGIPLHIIRQLYHTFSSFQRRVAEVRRYRKATTNMHLR
jgi:E3 ubiquitin-protein ligase synoviolin